MATTCKLIAKNVLGSDTASVSFTSIPGTYTDLFIVCSLRVDRSTVTGYPRLTLNGSSSSYSNRELYGTGSVAASGTAGGTSSYIQFVASANATASTFGSAEIYIPNYAGSTNKSVSVTALSENNATSATLLALAGLWSNTAAITSMDFGPGDSATVFRSGSSFYLYGITKA